MASSSEYDMWALIRDQFSSITVRFPEVHLRKRFWHMLNGDFTACSCHRRRTSPWSYFIYSTLPPNFQKSWCRLQWNSTQSAMVSEYSESYNCESPCNKFVSRGRNMKCIMLQSAFGIPVIFNGVTSFHLQLLWAKLLSAHGCPCVLVIAPSV